MDAKQVTKTGAAIRSEFTPLEQQLMDGSLAALLGRLADPKREAATVRPPRN